MHDSALLGTVSNEWKRAVERTPQLANGYYPKKLSEIVAIALVVSILISYFNIADDCLFTGYAKG